MDNKKKRSPSSDAGLPSKRNRTADRDTVKSARGLKCTFHGCMYQLVLLILFYIRGFKSGKRFNLSTEDPDAEKFDDLIYEYVDDNCFLLLQAKHKLEETKQKKKITLNDLVTEDESREFCLLKYFKSYQALKVHPKFQGRIKHLIIFTNTDFKNLKDLNKNGIKTKSVPPDTLLQFANCDQSRIYKLSVDSGCQLRKKLIAYQDQDIDEFFEVLTFAVSQPNVDELQKLINSELNNSFSLDGIDLNTLVLQEMLDWFKNPQSNPKTEKDTLKSLDYISSSLCELKLIGCSGTSKARFDHPDIQFEPGNLPVQEIKGFQDDPAKKLLILQGESLFLMGFKLHQMLGTIRKKTGNNYFFQDLSELLNEEKLKMVLSAFERITLS
jgi:hypothetical protein